MSYSRIVDEAGLMAVAARLAVAWVRQQPPLTVFLRGDLGAGKTTFTRGFVQGCGHEGIVKSPTYTLVEPYDIAGKQVYHFDLYRLAAADELEFTGARDCFDEHAACLVEWPEKAAAALPGADIECELQVAGQRRQLEMRAHSPTGEALMLALKPD